MLAGAMATRPKLLLMDEPVGGLTSAETDLMMETVRRIKAKGVTIILIEHVMRFLVALSDRIMILHHGERIYEGLAAGLVRDKTVVDVYLGEGASARLAALLHEPAP
jgi:branched-chain amino acid transport system ATP-binding protein